MKLLKHTKIMLILLLFIFLQSAGGQTVAKCNIDKRLSIIVAGNWGSLKNDKLNNEYIERWIPGDYLDDKISTGFGYSGEIFCYLSGKFSVSVGLIYINGSSTKDRIIIPYSGIDTVNTEDYVKTRIYAPTFSVRYHINYEKAGYFIGLSESLLLGKATQNLTFNMPIGPPIYVLNNEYNSNAFGFQIFAGIWHNLNNIVAVDINIGYRLFKTGDLIEKETEAVMRHIDSISLPPINLDYSGPYISAGLMFRLF